MILFNLNALISVLKLLAQILWAELRNYEGNEKKVGKELNMSEVGKIIKMSSCSTVKEFKLFWKTYLGAIFVSESNPLSSIFSLVF